MHSENHSTIASSEHAEHTNLLAKTLETEDLLAKATGPVMVPLTNDFLVKTFLQRNRKALRGLVAALLHLHPEVIKSIIITNPIEPGDSITDKTTVLDLKICLNDNTLLNLEMQVINKHNWPDRSLTYLCRAFDQLKSGDEYSTIKPTIQIGFLDFTLFPEAPEFYATYKMLNVKTHAIYNDKFVLSVVNLSRINLATEEDKQYHIDHWASLFKATTWEDIKVLATQNEYIKEAADTIFQLSADERIRQQCQAREDALYWEWEEQQRMEALKTENTDLKTENAELKAQIAQLEAALEAKS